MNFVKENDVLTIFIDGTINSANADSISAEIEEIRTKENHSLIVVDFSNVTYISSAGLRIFLNIKKQESSLEITNVSNEVYEVFSMTGFTEIIPIKKGLKVVSIEGKELIGEGYMGRVYRIDEDTIIKVNYRDNCIDGVQRERELAKKALILGVPTAISYDVVKVKEGGFGSMFELLRSDTLNRLIANNPNDFNHYLDVYVDLFTKIHEAKDEERVLPSKKEIALSWVESIKKENIFADDVNNQMEALIKAIPDDTNIIHGDYHVKNVMMQGDEALLIDMDTLGYGNIIFELVAMYLTYYGYPSTDPGNLEAFLGITPEQGDELFKTTITKSLNIKDLERVEKILALLGYYWLAYKTLIYEKENTKRLNHAIDMVNELINKVDNLII